MHKARGHCWPFCKDYRFLPRDPAAGFFMPVVCNKCGRVFDI